MKLEVTKKIDEIRKTTPTKKQDIANGFKNSSFFRLF